MKKTAKGAVQDYLNQYKNLSSNVINDMDTVINNENLTDNQKEKYRDILKKQYQDLKYDVVSEKYDGDNATVEVKIKVYDLYKVQKDANDYLTTSGDEFKQNGVFSNDLFMNYKLDKMKKTTDTVEYNIIFNVTKDDKGNFIKDFHAEEYTPHICESNACIISGLYSMMWMVLLVWWEEKSALARSLTACLRITRRTTTNCLSLVQV